MFMDSSLEGEWRDGPGLFWSRIETSGEGPMQKPVGTGKALYTSPAKQDNLT